jgi:glucokinase-like ROK family protein
VTAVIFVPGDAAAPDNLVTVLEMVRQGIAVTKPEIMRMSGLGKTVVYARVDELIDSGILAEGEVGPSTGGRAPRILRFCEDAAVILVAEFNSVSLMVGITDLAGRLITQRGEPCDVMAGPEWPMTRVEQLFDEMIVEAGATMPPVWGIGIGVLGPVDSATGRPVPIAPMRDWGNYDVRGRLSTRYGVPVWVENEVNLMALGEHRAGRGRGHDDLVYLKIGNGIAAGILSNGHLHRGRNGAAGEIGHLPVSADTTLSCWCGNTGCLVSVAGEVAVLERGNAAALSGQSAYLSDVVKAGDQLTVEVIGHGASQGDPTCIEILQAAGTAAGDALSGIVTSLNPSLILLGGSVSASSGLVRTSIRRRILARAFPLSTSDLHVDYSPLSDRAGLIGASFLVIDHLLSPSFLHQWIEEKSPAALLVAN